MTAAVKIYKDYWRAKNGYKYLGVFHEHSIQIMFFLWTENIPEIDNP